MSEPLPQELYALPDWVPPSLQVVHTALLSRMRAELIEARVDSVIVELLVERIAFNYILLRFKEGLGQEDNPNAVFSNERNQKEFNTFWLEMTREYRRATEGIGDPETIRQNVQKTMVDAIATAAADMPPQVRNEVTERLIHAIESAEV